MAFCYLNTNKRTMDQEKLQQVYKDFQVFCEEHKVNIYAALKYDKGGIVSVIEVSDKEEDKEAEEVAPGVTTTGDATVTMGEGTSITKIEE